MKKLISTLLCTVCCCLVLSSCGGGGESKQYSLSCNDFMAGRKFLLFSTPSCAFLIRPTTFSNDEVVHNEVLCPGQVYVYSESNSTNIELTCEIPTLRYSVDGDGNATLSFSAITPNGVNSYWMALCGALAGTGGNLGGGSSDSDYVKLSDVTIMMNFAGDDKGTWEDSCTTNYQGVITLNHGSGSLLLRPYEYLYGK